MSVSNHSFLMCHLGQRSQVRCGPNVHSPLQTLDELDAASMRVPGKSVKISWMMLSRVGIQFLNAQYGWWTVCPNHRKEYLDAWQVGKTCCHPLHKVNGEQPPPAENMVTMVMSVKVLQSEGQLIPISGKLCQNCKNAYDNKYGGKQTEKVVVFVPRTGVPISGDALAIPSPFFNPEQPHQQPPLSPPPYSLTLSPPTCIPVTSPSISLMSPTISVTPSIQQAASTLNSPNPLIASGFLMHSTLNTNKQRKTRNTNQTRGFALQKTIAPDPIPEPASEPEIPPTMWQVLGLQRAPNAVAETASADESVQNLVPENRTISPESDDDSFTGITIKMEVDETVKTKQVERPDDVAAENVHVEEEERPASAMSLFSNDSDDDPTWAPCPEKLKKIGANNIPEKPRLGRKPNAISPLKSLKKIKKIAEKKAKKEAKKLKSKKGRKLKEKKEKKIKVKKQKKESASKIDIAMTSKSEATGDVAEKTAASDGAAKPTKSGNDFHFLCTFCQISFYRETAYKHHMGSNIEFHRTLEQKAKNRKEEGGPNTCSKCKVSFKDRVSYQRHMAEEHSSGEHPFFCQKCSVYLKCEAAFKSHNSKLHLERRDKLFYCRECDETFGCKLKHSRHIVTHRTWSTNESGMQCKVCGKVFSKSQTLPFHKHLATHADELDEPCGCRSCRTQADLERAEEEAEKRELEIESGSRKRTRKSSSWVSAAKAAKVVAVKSELKQPISRSSLLEKMQSNFNAFKPLTKGGSESSTSADDDEEEMSNPFECGVCRVKFASAQKLELHVNKSHNKKQKDSPPQKIVENSNKKSIQMAKDLSGDILDEITNEFVIEIEKEDLKENQSKQAFYQPRVIAPQTGSKELSRRLVDKSKIVIFKPTEKNWQECAARNWAAEFGYGNPTKTSGEVSKRSVDLISMMKSKFFTEEKDEEEQTDEAADQVYRSRGLKGVKFVRASPAKEPRTLSSSSLRSRKRMESLLLRARDFMLSRDKDQKPFKATRKTDKKTNQPVESSRKTVLNAEPVQEPDQLAFVSVENIDQPAESRRKTVLNAEPVQEPDQLAFVSVENIDQPAESRRKTVLNAEPVQEPDKLVFVSVENIDQPAESKRKTVLNADPVHELNQLVFVSVQNTDRLSEPEQQPDLVEHILIPDQLSEVIQEPDELAEPVQIPDELVETIQIPDVPFELETAASLLTSPEPRTKRPRRERVAKPVSFVSSPAKKSKKHVTFQDPLPNDSNPKDIAVTPEPVVEQFPHTVQVAAAIEEPVAEEPVVAIAEEPVVAIAEEPVVKVVEQTPTIATVLKIPTVLSTATVLNTVTAELVKTAEKASVQNVEKETAESSKTVAANVLEESSEEMAELEEDSESGDELEEDDFDDEDDEEFSDFECILDVDEDSDGLLIPLENGWVCEKNWSQRSGSYSTHFWSPDGRRHSSLTVIQFYAEKKKLNLNMSIFERALKNNPPRKNEDGKQVKRKKLVETRTTRSRSGPASQA